MGRYDNPIPTLFLAPIDCLKIPALSNSIENNGEVLRTMAMGSHIELIEKIRKNPKKNESETAYL
jgi:hypothetical protein